VYAAIYIPDIGPTGSVDLLRVARTFAPEVESTEPEIVVFSIAGLRRLIGSVPTIAGEIARRAHEHGLDGSIGVARTRDLAVLAARTKRGVTVIAPGDELTWLGGVRLAILPLKEETTSLLSLWGVETLEQFCALPEAGLFERLGADAALLHRLARGESDRPLVLEKPVEIYRERVALEYALDNLEPLLFLVNRLLHEFCARLDRQTMSAAAVHLTCELERREAVEHRIELPVPVRDAKLLLRLVQAKLEAGPPPAPVKAFTLAVDPVAPRFLQHDLYEPPRPEPAKLELTLAKIRGLVGTDRVGTPQLLNTHRPDAWRLTGLPNLNARKQTGAQASAQTGPQWGLAFRFYRPAKQAQVVVEGGGPVFVAADGVRGDVKERAGPWVKSGDWWAGEAWGRQEWDVALRAGGVYRLYYALSSAQRWFVEGSYD
jgi:protein ImuB